MFAKTASLALVGALFSAGLATAQDTQSAGASQNVPKFQYGTPNPNAPGVVSANKNGPTNPKSPQLNTPINQTSDARLASINSVDDWCTFGPPTQTTIGDIEGETVAYCTKARNNARVIPDGTVTAVHFIKTPLYVQVMANGDFTKINVVPGDYGGELDPHGATDMGNPVGGNVTSNVSGKDVFYEEWMNYISYSQMCFRVCIAGTEEAPTSAVCQHTLDEMGCNWVMPGSYTDNVFETCDGDVAYPPGLYPQGNGQTSTFQQYFSSVFTDKSNGNMYTFVNGSPDQATPTAAYSIPATSSCSTTQSIANGIASIVSSSSASSSSASMATSASSSGGARGSSSTSGAGANASNAAASSGNSGSTSGAASFLPGATAAGVVSVIGGLVAVVALL